MKKLLLLFLSIGISISAMAQLVGGNTYPINGTDNGTNSFASLRSAIAYLQTNGVTGTGQVILEFTSSYDPTIADAPASGATKITIPAITGTSTTLGITIRPAIGVTVALSANVDAAGLIELNGANYITIDGRSGGIGSTGGLTIENLTTSTNAGTAAVRFINDAQYNTVTYCTLKSATTNSNSQAGSVLFNTSTGTKGNSNNTISNNTLTFATGATSSRTAYQIVSYGSAGAPNAANTIINNNISDYQYRAVYLYSTGTPGLVGDGWIISGNSIFNAATVTTGTSYSICILGTGSGHTITDNYIGGQAAQCGGSAMSVYAYNGIYVAASDAGATTVIQNNTIANISANYTTTLTAATNIFYLVYVSGNVDVLANNIGSQTSTDNIILATNTTQAYAVYSFIFYATGSGKVNIKDNLVGGITFNPTGVSTSGYYARMVNPSSSLTNTLTVEGNTFGGSVANSIKNSGTGRGVYLYGILTSVPTSFRNNVIRNFTNTTAATMYGYYASVSSTGGTYAIENNTFSDFTNASTILGTYFSAGASSITNTVNINNNVLKNFASSSNISGIYNYSSSSYTSVNLNGTISGNTLSNFISTGTTISDVVAGINSGISPSATLEIKNNSISNLSTSGTNTTNTSSSVLYGISHSVTSTGVTITGNTVHDLTCTGVADTHVMGIGSYGGRQISGNKIYNLYNVNATSGATIKGIVLRYLGTFNAYNNIISLTGINNDVSVYGMESNSNAGTVANIYHNTIQIAGNLASGTAVSAAIYRGNATPFTIINNVFNVSRSGGTGVHTALHSTETSAGWLTNYNLYVVPSVVTSTVSYFGATAYNFADWQVTAPNSGDANSILGQLDPTLMFANQSSPYFMSISASYDAYFKAKGTPVVSVTTDIGGNVRSATEPSIGAWEANTTTLLPVNISTFTAKLNNNKVALNWTVGLEANVNRYVVERSQNGADFIKVTEVTAKGLPSYAALDVKPELGMNYYRLKAIDNDGSINPFSELRNIRVETLETKEAWVYPNPIVGNAINVNLLNYAKGDYSYKLTDVTGKVVQKGNFMNSNAEINKITVSSLLQKGIYILYVTNGNELVQTKLVKP